MKVRYYSADCPPRVGDRVFMRDALSDLIAVVVAEIKQDEIRVEFRFMGKQQQRWLPWDGRRFERKGIEEIT